MEHQFQVHLNIASQYYHSAKEDPNNLITLDDDEKYLVIHHPWFRNYYHWITEAIPRLWMVRQESSSMILLLPPLGELPVSALKSLEAFNLKGVFHIPSGKSVLVNNLFMPELKPTMASFNRATLFSLKNIFTEYTKTIKINVDLGDRILLSRRKSRRRKIINEDQVIAELARYNFTVVYNEDYTFLEQISIYSNAKCLISTHGAGMTNMLFMPKGSTIFEFHKRKTNAGDKQSFVFWYMSNSLCHNYYHQICDPLDADEHFFTADMLVDIELFKKNLKLMLLY
ncbi:glycosyltransferase family 61 protein [Mucilaginibacter paludis]|uniref:Glycosyltransferase 61 catalytic domain-containing protein n=1 Tax=Mucilaginibacter paludis DSM 18603 TaxID=714943 RepID=H1YIG7_9SPHI|nr:glycosyltransferase family 61 protein [Mucilaginibacter paludis]EHQ27580.1 hypothetical protein Mucpa_3482 [Mucilaginibacter paludis DSM 18603]